MTTAIDTINSLLELTVKSSASDLHLKSKKPALIRLHGRLKQVDMPPMDPSLIAEFVTTTIPTAFIEKWKKDSQIDYSYHLPNESIGRFRVNAFHQRGMPSIVFRHIKNKPPSFDDLNHEDTMLRKLSELHDGIVLVCGPTGSGKSSTIAAMLNHINTNFEKHVVTLEDPIEFNYEDKRSLFSQREIGIDAPDFNKGLIAVLRQDPDVILIGEMRDQETFETALHAAETGHLVFATLHSANVQQAIQRIFEFFPANEQDHMRRQIASTLKGVITQKLAIGVDNASRVPVVELLYIEALAKKIILAGEFQKIPNVLESSKENGSKSYNMDLIRLVNEGKITKESALDAAPNRDALEMNMKGIFLSSGGIVN